MPRLPVYLLDVKDFLRLPDFKPPLEFIDGRVIQKIAKDLPRSAIQGRLLEAIDAFARPRQLGRVYPSLRVLLGGSVLVPEISFYRSGRLPKYVRGEEAKEITTPPDIAMEFLAPGQSPAEPRRKLRHLINHEGKLGWLIDPNRERIAILRPGRSLEMIKDGDVLSGEGILPGFSLPVEEIFGWLDGG